MQQSHRRSVRGWWVRAVVAGGLVLAAGIAVGWALATVLRPSADPLDETLPTIVEVRRGDVGSQLRLNVTVDWNPLPAATNRARGVVTSVTVGDGEAVSPGEVLYALDLRPVVAASGRTPAFRDLEPGLSGEDVTQLQELLAELGHLSVSPTGTFDEATTAAVVAWQAALGVAQTGTVGVGDLMFLPDLPTHLVTSEDVLYSGASLTGGERVLASLDSEPTFTLPVTSLQAGMITTGTVVRIVGPEGHEWTGRTGEEFRDEYGNTSLALVSGSEGPICGRECGTIPAKGQSLLGASVITVETVSGLTIPSAALVTDAGGETLVLLEDGHRVPVVVIASARGMSVVEGVAVGTRVQIPGDGTP